MTTGFAQEPQMLAPEAHEDWQAIGRLNRAGYNQKSLCSAVLISPNTVLTAAHCVTHRDGTLLRPEDLHFVAGWFRGAYADASNGKSIQIPKAWATNAAQGKTSVYHDYALVTLTTPITSVAPRAVQPVASGPVRILGYRWDRPHALTDSGLCQHVTVLGGAESTSCQVTFGTSGAPVLQRHSNGWSVVGTVSAIGGGKTYFAPWRPMTSPADP